MFIKKSLKKLISIFLTVTFFTSCLMGQAGVLFANEQDIKIIVTDNTEQDTTDNNEQDINIIVTDNSEQTSKSNGFSIEQNIDRPVITKNKIIFPKQFIPSSKGDRSSESGIYFWEERYWPRPKRIKTQPFNETIENDPGLFINDSIEEQENNNNVPFYDTEYNNYSESSPLTINEPMFLAEQNIFSPETAIDEIENVNKLNDRFIIKYKNEKIKDDTAVKIKGNLKQTIHSKNEKFDIFVTENKMTIDSFKDLIKQKNADTNIEYIQPDYQLTVASEDTPQLLETIQEVQEKNNAPLNNTIDTTEETTSDTRAPSLLKIIFNETKIEIEYDENLKTDLLPSKTDFLVSLNNGQFIQIESIEIKENILTLTTQTTLTAEDIVLVSYTPETNPVADLAGNPVDGFDERKAEHSAVSGTNSAKLSLDIVKNKTDVDKNSPVLNNAILGLSTIILGYDEPLDAESTPAVGDFRLTLDDKPQESVIQSVYMEGWKIILNLDISIAAGDLLKISYTPGNNPVKDLAGNPAAGFLDLIVKNPPKQLNDPHFNQQWGLLPNQFEQPGDDNLEQSGKIISIGIDAINAWKQSEGEDVVVAVLDTGIDISHEDLKDNIWINKAEIPGNGIDDDGNGFVDDVNGWNFTNNTCSVHDPEYAYDEWHGTHIAGIIAAVKGNEKGIAGVAPKAKIMPLQVFNGGVAYTSDIIDAIVYADKMGAKIVNCSWGSTSENLALKEVMEELGLTFICAAGNSFKNIDKNPVYPASFTSENIISVASINRSGNLSNFSNYGQISIDVAAPGENILSTTPGDGYGESGGTSQAAAFVAGEVALLWGKYPDSSLSEIKIRLMDSSDKLSSITEKVYGANKINCASALADPVITNNYIIQIPEQGQGPETGTSDNGDYSLFSIDEWNTSGNLLTARYSFGTAVLNDKIYAIGGGNDSWINTVEIYDPISGTSTYKANLNTARSGMGATATDGKIYAIGGFDGSYFMNTVEEYNPTTNTWSYKSNMPTARYGLGAVAVNGKIYAIGGYRNSAVNYVQEYNPSTNTWSTKASMPTARTGLGVAVVNGKIYAIGGHTDGGYVFTVEEYNPVTNSWATKASMPEASIGFAVTAINGKIYLMGGIRNSSYLNSVYEYNPETDVWIQRANLPTRRYGLRAAAANGKIYALGGYYHGYLSNVEEYSLPTNKWKTLPSMPTSRSELGAAAVSGKIYAIGGYNGTSYLNTVEEYDPTSNTWSTKASMPTARSSLEAVAVNGKIYVIGGYNGSSCLNTVEE